MKALLLALLLTGGTLHASIVATFDDLPNPGEETLAVPDGYAGINWSAGNWQYYAEAQSPYTAHSGENRAYSYNADNTFSFVTPGQIFDGAWFAGGSGTNDAVHFVLYREGAVVATSDALIVSSTPTFLASGYAGLVDAVAIAESPVVRPIDTDFVVDDITYTATPEPSSLLLSTLAAGLLYVIRFRTTAPDTSVKRKSRP